METSNSETDFARDIVRTETPADTFRIYRTFLENFAENVDPTDQLPVRVPNYTLEEYEISGAVIDWMIQYLTDKNCPQTLVAPLVKISLDQTHQTLRKTPEQYGYLAKTNEYQTLKLMQLSISKINDVCQSLLDNLQLDKLIPCPPSKQPALYSAKGVKNSRRHMEDRHIIIDDFNSVFGIKDSDTTSYYAIFDGHGGIDAASYSVSHLHCEIVGSKFYPSKPHEALREAFLNTDDKFIEKSKKQKLLSGTTALCALYRPTERLLVVGWVGDSKALLVSQNRVLQIVNPHKPDSESERRRIERNGGCVLEFPAGCFRVNGRLAVSRAIGDYGLKDVVIGEPDIAAITLNGKEDFLILGCDGLWDYVEEDEVATKVYTSLERNNGDVQPIAGQLIELSKKNSSTDNISVIVVFLKDPHQIITEYKLADKSQVTRMDFESTNGCHQYGEGLLATEPSEVRDEIPSSDKMHVDFDKSSDVHHDPIEPNNFYYGKNVDDEFQANVNTIPSNKTSNGSDDKFSSKDLNVARSTDDDDEDHDDFGPETDVDATDDNAISPLSPSGYDFIERVGIVATDENQGDISEGLVKKPEQDAEIPHQFEDNRFMEHVSDHFVNTVADNHFELQNEHFEDDEPELANKIDFAEKKVFNEEEFDEDDDDDDDMNADVSENFHHMHNVITSECEQHVLPTNNSVPIENVVVAESGDDSEDEWNYIKVDKEIPEQEHQSLIGSEDELGKESSKPIIEEADIISSTPPTASASEIDLIHQESHAIAQAFVEPEEVCSELIDEKEDTEHPELLELERAERSSSVAAEHDSDLANEQDLEEMDSQLNPDAKEFIPVSPQRSSGSPFNNGLHNRFDLMDDDVVSQSPRKGSGIVMEDNDIVLPAENDFTEISQRPSELVVNELNFDNIHNENGNVDEKKEAQRPESSNSQCSYQEMNLKEAMHGDEKQELAAEVQEPDNHFNACGDGIVPITNGGQQFLSEQDPMNMSFYNDQNNPFKSQEVDMNAVQPLPDDVDDEVTVENEPEHELVDFVSQPIELNNERNQSYGEVDELIKEFSSESEKLHQNQESIEEKQEEPEQPTPITSFVQELATEVTSILREVNDQNQILAIIDEPQTIETGTESVTQSESIEDVINHSGLSADANEFVPTVIDANEFDDGFEAVQSCDISNPEQNIRNESIESIQQHQSSVSIDEPCIDSEAIIPAESLQPEQKSEIEPLIQIQAEPVVESASEPVVAPAAAIAVAATTAVVAAAAAVGVAKTASLKKPTDAKKTEIKSKAAPLKKAATTTASKVAAKPSNTVAPRAAAPKVASRTIPPKVGTTTEKKTTTASLVNRKPISNGSVPATVGKKTATTTSTVTKTSTIGATRTTLTKPASARTASATTTASKTTAPKPAGTSTSAVPRVPLSARTLTKPATATGTTSRVSSTKTSTSTASSTTTSRAKSAQVTSTSRSTTLTKPKISVSSVTKSAVSKVSPTKTSTLTAKSPGAKTSLGASSTTARTTPTRKPLSSTLTKTTPSKSPKVPTTNGVASKTKAVGRGVVSKEKVTTNVDSKQNGHIGENGTGAEKIIDVSAD